MEPGQTEKHELTGSLADLDCLQTVDPDLFVIEQMKKWVESGLGRVKEVEDEIARKLRAGEGQSLSQFSLLGLSRSSREDYVSEALLHEMELNQHFSPRLYQAMEQCAQENSPESRTVLHAALSFFSDYQFAMQGEPGMGLERRYHGYRLNRGVSRDIDGAGSLLAEQSPNYLIRRHCEDVAAGGKFMSGSGTKSDVIDGMMGGGVDEIIYTYRHADESFWLRQQLGIRQGVAINHPVLPLAKGWAGEYRAGELIGLYKVGQEHHDLLAAPNVPDHYYDELNVSAEEGDSSRWGLMKFHVLQSIREEVGEPVYDLSRLDSHVIHPQVLADIYMQTERSLNLLARDNPKEPAQKYQLSDLGDEFLASEDLLREYPFLVSLSMRQKIEPDFGIGMEELTLAEQRAFLLYLNGAGNEEAEAFQANTKRLGLPYLQTFLALDRWEGAREAVDGFCRTQPEEYVRQVLGQYAQLVTSGQQVEELLKEMIPSVDSAALAPAVQVKVLDQAADLLRLGTDAAAEPRRLQDRLSDLTGNAVVFAKALRAAKDAKLEVSLEDFTGFESVQKTGAELDEGEREELLRVAGMNWEGKGKLGADIMKGLSASLRDPSARFYIGKADGVVMGFFRLDARKDGSLYFGSVNANPSHLGSSFGRTFLDQVFMEEAAGKKVEADCDLTARISGDYLERYGFSGTEVRDYTGEGAWSLHIVRDDSDGNLSPGGLRTLSDLEVVQQLDVPGSAWVHTSSGPRDPAFSDFIEKLRARMGAGEVLTALRQLPVDDKRILCAGFEPKPSEE